MFNLKKKKQILQLEDSLTQANSKITELEKQLNSIRALLENMVEGVMTLDKDSRIVSINNSIEKIFAISKKESEGRFLLEVIRNNDIAEVVNKVLSDGKFISKELTLVWPVQKNFKVNASPILENSAISGCLLVINHIIKIRR